MREIKVGDEFIWRGSDGYYWNNGEIYEVLNINKYGYIIMSTSTGDKIGSGNSEKSFSDKWFPVEKEERKFIVNVIYKDNHQSRFITGSLEGAKEIAKHNLKISSTTKKVEIYSLQHTYELGLVEV